MRKALFTLGLTTLLLLASSCGQTANTAEFRLVASVDELMHGMVEPLSTVIWESVATIVSFEGIEEIVPENDEEWEVVVNSALALGEVANLLLIEARAAEYDSDWIELSSALTDTSLVAADAAKSQDADALLLAGGYLYESCVACHEKYLVEEEF